MKVVTPPNVEKCYSTATIFLAGPIKGAPDWQNEVINKFKAEDIDKKIGTELFIFNPRKEYEKDEFIFERQVDWETFYLNKTHTILFWLPKEEVHITNRAYGETSRFELGEWLAKVQYIKDPRPSKRLILGIEDGFSGKNYIMRRLQTEYQIPIYHDLDSCIWAYRSGI